MPIYSPSRLSIFEICPLKYKFQYIEKPKIERFTPISFFLGSQVHFALEHLYKELLSNNLLSLENLLSFYKKEWEKNISENVKVIKRNQTKNQFFKKGISFLNNYYKRYHPFDQDKTLALEKRVIAKIGNYRLCGYIDRFAIKNGIYEIHDYKTSSSLPSQKEIDSERQLSLYALAISQRFPDAERINLVWHYLAFDKEIRLERGKKSLSLLQKETLKIISSIENAVKKRELPPKKSPLCRWCDFQKLCPEFSAQKICQTKLL